MWPFATVAWRTPSNEWGGGGGGGRLDGIGLTPIPCIIASVILVNVEVLDLV